MRALKQPGGAGHTGVKISAVLLALVFLLPACTGAKATESTESPEKSAVSSVLEESFEPPAGNSVLDQISLSYSAGQFVEGAVSADDLEMILRSGAKAPSAKNAQPWRFTVITQESAVQRLYQQAAAGTVLVVLSGQEELATDTVEFDCGLAAGYMQLAAESLGYGARILISPVSALEQDREEYGIPEGYKVLAAIAIGQTDVDDAATATPRDPLSELVNDADLQ